MSHMAVNAAAAVAAPREVSLPWRSGSAMTLLAVEFATSGVVYVDTLLGFSKTRLLHRGGPYLATTVQSTCPDGGDMQPPVGLLATRAMRCAELMVHQVNCRRWRVERTAKAAAVRSGWPTFDHFNTRVATTGAHAYSLLDWCPRWPRTCICRLRVTRARLHQTRANRHLQRGRKGEQLQESASEPRR